MRELRKIVYLYRDAGNYKYWGEFCVMGNVCIDDLRPHLLDSEYFVPEKIGLPSLVPNIRNDDDHMLHELYSIEPTTMEPFLFTAAELSARLRTANDSGWF